MIHVMARVVFQPESAAVGRELLSALVAESRREEGCASYELFQQIGVPHGFQTVEQWVDQDAIDGHMKSAHVRQAIAAAMPMLAGAPEIVRFERIV